MTFITGPIPGGPPGILLSSIVKHPFSDPHKQDTFKLVITGKSVLNGQALFEIINYAGHSIYKETFGAGYLAEKGSFTDPEAKEAYIRERVRGFFHERNFIIPAVRQNDNSSISHFNKQDVEDLRADRSAIGFSYHISDKRYYRIAWSKKQKMVVIYQTAAELYIKD